MNPETKKVLQNKVNEIDTRRQKLLTERDNIERILKGNQASFDRVKKELEDLQNKKNKIKEDINKD